MAKKILAFLLTLIIIFTLAIPVFAKDHNHGQGNGNGTEYIAITINGNREIIDQGESGNDRWLTQGEYTSSSSLSEDKQTITVEVHGQQGQNRTASSTVPYEILEYEMNGVNSQSETYDNVEIYLTVTKVRDPETGEEYDVNPDVNPIDVIEENKKPKPTDPEPEVEQPEPTDPVPTEPEVEETEPAETESEIDLTEPTEPADPIIPPPTEPPYIPPQWNYDPVPMSEVEDNIDIPDEDVPLADVPKTGDISSLWIISILLSGGGVFGLSLKKKE